MGEESNVAADEVTNAVSTDTETLEHACAGVRRLGRLGILLLTVVALIAVAWTFWREHDQAEVLAGKEASANFNKDLSFRKWATRHGGVYVKVNERTPPNPYLAHLPKRDLTSDQGDALTLMNPAYMMRQMTTEFEQDYGIKGHITALVLLNPINGPDGWERRVLEGYQQDPREVMEVAEIEGQAYLRLMRPMFMTQGCVKCHGFLGFKDGDLRGGISVAIPLQSYYADAQRVSYSMFGVVGGFWLFGVLGVVRYTRGRLQQVTSSHRYTTALAAANSELQSKNSELEQILYVSSHDLRSPLVNIHGYGKELSYALEEFRELLNDERVSAELRQQYAALIDEDMSTALGFILNSAGKMDGLLTGLLKLSRLGRAALKFEQLDMNRLMEQVRADFEFQLGELGAQLQIDELPRCFGDAMQVNQVFANLLDNALKYRDPQRPLQMHIRGRVEGRVAIYEIDDNGIGIAPEHQARIFEIFQRLHVSQSEGEGEGLGLTIVQRTLGRLNGIVWLQSTLGRGSRFIVELPIAEA